jgi:hypothetical protein
MLVEANDPRGINVAVLSRYKINSSTSHQEIEKDITYPDGTVRRERVFRRDCLEVEIKKDGNIIPVFQRILSSRSGFLQSWVQQCQQPLEPLADIGLY